MRSVYFDYNATTPLDPQVREAMEPFLGEIFGNPSSLHHVGRRARALLDDARDRVAGFWGSKPSEVIFTSGGTESNNLAIFGAARLRRESGRHLITSSIEHDAVRLPFKALAAKEGFELTILPVDASGQVDPADLAKALRSDTVLVSVMAANNETGTIQPVAELGRICRERGILFHTDAVQWFGKLPFRSIHDFEADLVTVCSHKFHGPKGAGALFIRSPLLPEPLLYGGGHELERRAGTENLPAIIGLTEALIRFATPAVFSRVHLEPHASRLIEAVDALSDRGVTFRGSRTDRLPNTVAFTVAGADSISMLAGLDLEGICASSGSACSAGSLEPSHVMLAMGVDPTAATALVRFSLGRENTPAEVDWVVAQLPSIIERSQAFQ